MKQKILCKKPILGFVAWSGTGKTTLLEKIIPIIKKNGFRIALIKHAHHDFDIDTPGKDSFRLRKAGASETIVASAKRWALIHENDNDSEQIDLSLLIGKLDLSHIDLVLVEGFKHIEMPRIELYRPVLNKKRLYQDDKNIIAIATDASEILAPKLTQLDINNYVEISSFIIQEVINHEKFQS